MIFNLDVPSVPFRVSSVLFHVDCGLPRTHLLSGFLAPFCVEVLGALEPAFHFLSLVASVSFPVPESSQ